jgi:butyryl-CoA dehydrogenase
LSLFIVPRRRDGQDNGVSLTGLDHKMGWRGHVNTAIAFGANGPCIGELVGAEGQGLPQMFLLMNEARVGIGLVASALGYAGYSYALAYARERRQGRALESRDPTTPQIPLIKHADVRRMLLAQKAWVEGGLDLVLYCAMLVDDRTEDAALLLDLLTPIVKSWPAEWCLEANKQAIQVAGGAGYTRDLPLERLYRDNRLNHIHEGACTASTASIFSVVRVTMRAGRAFRETLADAVLQSIDAARPYPALAECVAALGEALGALTQVTATPRAATAARGEVALATANATIYLDAFGTVVVAWRWLARAAAASARIAAGRANERAAEHDFYAGKVAACRHFFRHDLARTAGQFALLAALDDTALRIDAAQF